INPGAMSLESEQHLASGRFPHDGGLVVTARNNPPTVRGKGHRTDPVAVPLESEQYLATGSFPHDGVLIVTARNNPLAVRREGHRPRFTQMASQRLQGQVSLPLPVVPFKTTIRRRLRLVQQLPQPAEVVLLPGLLSKVHIGYIQEEARFDF